MTKHPDRLERTIFPETGKTASLCTDRQMSSEAVRIIFATHN